MSTRLSERAVAVLTELEPEVEPALYRLRDQAAALHLFRVAAGLDSLVPGEGEILGQVRAAYEAGSPGQLLDRVFRQALHAGRKVRAQTAIGESPASVSSAAAALAEQVFGDLNGCRILLIGVGKVGEQAARNLRTRGAEIVLTANSKTDRAELEQELARVDVVVSSTSSAGFVLDAATVERARNGRQLLFIDLAVPRDLDPAIHELDGCFLYDIDDLEAIVSETLAGRRGEATRAEAIVADRGREVPRLAGFARRGTCDRIAPRPRRGDPRGRAPQGRRRPRQARRHATPSRRVHDVADRQQAAAPPDRPHEAGGGVGRRGHLC